MPADPAYATRWLPDYLLMGLGVALTLPQLSSAAVQGLTPARFAAGARHQPGAAQHRRHARRRGLVVILAGAAPDEVLAAFHETSVADRRRRACWSPRSRPRCRGATAGR